MPEPVGGTNAWSKFLNKNLRFPAVAQEDGVGGKVWLSFVIEKDGSLSNKKLFTNQGSDGMTIDNEGNIYLTGKGVTVYNKEGKMIQHFAIPEDWTANVCFGGKNMDELFITASKSVYTLHTKVKGVQ